jgi:thioredoxin-related protein
MPPKKIPSLKPKVAIKSIQRSLKTVSSSPEWTNYFLIAAILALVFFSIVYIINISRISTKTNEHFDQNVVAPKKVEYSVTLVYSHNCGHCTHFKKDTWANFNPSVIFPDQIVTKKEVTAAEKGSNLPDVQGVPTIFVSKDNSVIGTIVGFRDLDAFVLELKKLII